MVITLDKRKRPLSYCSPKRARQLVEAGRACVYRYFPYTLILKDKDSRKICPEHDYQIKIDPGSRYTGIAVLDGDRVILYLQIEHRGQEIVDNLTTRRSCRRNRRSRETVYRRCKFKRSGSYESPREEGWLPPSQESIVDNIIHWVDKLIRLLGPCKISMEFVKFDTQKMNDPDIEGKKYQQGTLQGYELKEYLLEKYQYTCQYCAGKSGDHRLEWEHMLPRSRGGSDSVKNATLSCHICNQQKGSRTPEEWLRDLQGFPSLNELGDKRVACLKNVISGKTNGQHLRYAAWANSVRWRLYNELKKMSADGDIEVSPGWKTSYNRHVHGIAKAHHYDALFCGNVPDGSYKDIVQPVLAVKAMGRGTRLLGQINKCGIITVKYRDHHKRVNGLQTGDIVRAVTPNGKYKGKHIGRIMIRSRGDHDIRRLDDIKVGATRKSIIQVIQHADGYQYSLEKAIPLGN